MPLHVPNAEVSTLTEAAPGLAALWANYLSPAGQPASLRNKANEDAKVEATAGDTAAETSAAGVAKSERENSGAVTAVSVEKLGGGALLLVALLAGLMAPSIPDKSSDGAESGTAATGTDSETGAAAAGAD